MRFRTPAWGMAVVCASMISLAFGTRAADAATIAVPAGGNLQAALNAAHPGDVILLAAGATYVGNFVLPNKGAIAEPITIRSSASDASLPPAGVRMTPAYASLLPKIKSPNSISALRTATAANHWTLMFLEFQANQNGYGEIIALGAGDSTQTQLAQVPYALVLDRVYVHGDPVMGQKRGIALHSSDTTIVNSYVSDCKAVGQDSQALAGFNGPGDYLIENNYFEAATENVLFGGSDPPIQNLVTANITFRHNYLTKPLAWRDPIIATPAGVAAQAAIGAGTLPAGTYFYKVNARTAAGQTSKANSAPSVEVSATLPSAGAVTLSWTPVAGASDYVVYGRTSGGENMYWKTTAPYFSDAGAAGASGVPASTTRWSVKNLFELKNAEDVVVEGNVFENLWIADQSGYAIQFTPRNQDGRAPWAVVQRVSVRDNIVRHVAAAVNILGTDNLAPSQRTNHLTISNNVFDDLTSATWGSGSRPFQIGDGPDAITIDHNTVITTDSSILALYGGSATSPTPITNTVYTNNMSRHNTYGIFGANMSAGMLSINAYLPNGIVIGNVFAGGPASKYPAGNFFPSAAAWQADFVDYAGGDYHLQPSSAFKNAGTDGADLGANIDAVNAAASIAITGDSAAPTGAAQVHITTTTLPDGLLNQSYAQTLTCSGGTFGCAWRTLDAALPAGISFDPVAAVVMGTPTAVESGSITLQAYDPQWPGNTATATLALVVDAPPFVVDLPAAPAGQVGTPYQIAASASGALGSAVWSVASGSLPVGVLLDPQSGSIAGIPSSWGTTTALIQGEDSWGVNRIDAKPVTITIAPPAIAMDTAALPDGSYQAAYQARLAVTGGTGSIGWSIAAGSLPQGLSLSSDGIIAGTPTGVGTFTFAVLAIDTSWPDYRAAGTMSLTIAPPAFSALVPSAAMGRVALPYQLAATESGAVGSVSWTVAAGSLPAGLLVDPYTGVVSGIPTTSGSFTVVLQAHDSWNGRMADATTTIVIAPMPISIATSTLDSGSVSAAYSAKMSAVGGTGTTTWSIVAGALPSGLTLGADGAISGTPAAAGTLTFTVQASDAGWTSNTATQPLSITIAPEAGAIPAPWSHSDIGRVGSAGSAQYLDDAFTVKASGADVWGRADAFHYVYQPWSGDGTIVARVAGVSNANAWSKAGVMFRETLTPGSAHAFMLVSVAKGVAFQRREVTGGDSVHTGGSMSAAPHWVRLDRSGSTFTAYESADGLSWTLVGADTIPMADQIYVGFAVTSHDNTRTTTATAAVQTIHVSPFTVSAPAPAIGQVGVPYQLAATATGQVGTVAWSIASGALPGGVSIDAATGAMSGVPVGYGTYTAIVQAQDSYNGRIATAAITGTIAPTPLAIATPATPAARIGTPYQAVFSAIGGTGATTWAVADGSLPAGLAITADGVIAGSPAASGAATFTIQATDAGWPGNTVAQTFTIDVAASREIVLYAADAPTIAGTWSRIADATAAGGYRVWNADAGAAKLASALAAPANYMDLTFQAEAGVAYHLWVRGKADRNSWANDSMLVQFSQAVDQKGAAIDRIGSTSAATVSIEDGTNAGLAGWGWGDASYGALAAPVYFASTGTQTIRIQVREDGLSLDQIVISAEQYLATAPGAAKNDTTILPR